MKQLQGPRNSILAVLIAIAMLLFLVGLTRVAAQAPSADWETAAGGKMAFDSVVVKPDNSPDGKLAGNVDILTPSEDAPPGQHLEAKNFWIADYIDFAFRLAPYERRIVSSQLPKWAWTQRYDIEGNASGNPSMDQIRLMVQSVLIDRFGLKGHHEQRQVPVDVLVLAKPGKFGPWLRPHPLNAPPCEIVIWVPPHPRMISEDFPAVCHHVVSVHTNTGSRSAVRDATLDDIARFLYLLGNGHVDGPIVDRTGLTGRFDFSLIDRNRPPQGGDDVVPTFSEDVRNDLGLKLEGAKDTLDFFVVDHIEKPSAN